MATTPVVVQSSVPDTQQAQSPVNPSGTTASTPASDVATQPTPAGASIANEFPTPAATASVIPFPPAARQPTQYATRIYHYHVDPNGCPTRLTDTTGEIVWSASYAAWGEITQQHVAHIENPLRFQGQYFDAETGLHYNRCRYFEPVLGVYTAQDPIGLLGGDNIYKFAANALGWIDPLGLTPKHRGRIQAQGDKLEESISWAQDTPYTRSAALKAIDDLEASLSPKDRKARKQAFAKARAFVESAANAGGVDAQVSKTFMVAGTKHERVDIEVSSGKAFVPDVDVAGGGRRRSGC